jgi:hypothetical protein
MERVRISFKGRNPNETAMIDHDGIDIHLCAKGKRLMVSESELYDMVTLFMSQFYEDFTGEEE